MLLNRGNCNNNWPRDYRVKLVVFVHKDSVIVTEITLVLSVRIKVGPYIVQGLDVAGGTVKEIKTCLELVNVLE